MNFKIPPQIIISFIEANFTSYKITSSGEYRVNSPFDNDTKYHLYINPEKGVYNDFKSGNAGSFIQLVGEMLDISGKNALQLLITEFGSRRRRDNTILLYDMEDTKLVLPNVEFFVIKQKGIIRNIAYNYLVNRGIPEKNIEELGYIYDEDSEYNNMIFIPFYENHKIVYFICRDFTNHNFMRYNNPYGIDTKQFVYNIDKMKENGTVFIFEGVFNALSLDGQIGTAMLSSDLGKKQAVKILDTAPKTVVFVPDNDEAGRKSLNRNIKLFLKYKPSSLDINILIYNIENVNDFNESGEHHIDIDKCKKYKRIIINEVKFTRKQIV